MDESYLYRRIAESIRSDILEGRLQPGDRLPSIRQLTERWRCTTGTVQRAYQELAHIGLVVSQAGKGTHVTHRLDLDRMRLQAPLRQAGLVNRAESFLLEQLTAGHSLDDIQQAFSLALDRWRSYHPPQIAPQANVVRFSGSHDMALIWLAGHVNEIIPDLNIQLNFTGSLGGLMALAEGHADLAGAHLLDVETGQYNLPFITRLFPGRKMRITRLANRRNGLIVAAGNPLGIHSLADLARPDVRLINRQSGSGTRVWFDAALQTAGLLPDRIRGYDDEKNTHSEVARAIAEGKADAGIGLESAAAAFHLDFLFLVEEPYDLVTCVCDPENSALCRLLDWVGSRAGKKAISALKGYAADESGREWIV